MYVWVVVVLLSLLVWAWNSTRRPAWCPPGPPLLPWLGNLLSINAAQPYHSLRLWARQFGAVYHIRVGVTDLVILSDPAVIREAFGRMELAGRPDSELFRFVVAGTGLVGSQGELWQASRRLTLHHLKNFGMGKGTLEASMHVQIGSFMDEILTPGCGGAMEMGTALNVAVVNTIWKLVASEELSLTDPKMTSIIQYLAKSIEFAQSLAAWDAIGWLKHMVWRVVYKRDRMEQEVKDLMEAVFLPGIEEHRQELSLSGEPRDYIDAMLREQQKRPELLTDWHLLMSVLDLFKASNDTTAVTLRWAFCFLCSRPETQRRLQAELDREVGRQRLPSLADRPRLPYTEAVLLETQRLGDIAPSALPHATLAPATVAGYRLPAGVQVMANLHSVHRNPELFPEPDDFRPERFLDADGKFRPDKNVMAFSTGKRQCMGESFARAELFIFLTSIMQNFTLRWPEGFQHDFAEDPEGNFIRMPKPYKLVPEKR